MDADAASRKRKTPSEDEGAGTEVTDDMDEEMEEVPMDDAAGAGPAPSGQEQAGAGADHPTPTNVRQAEADRQRASTLAEFLDLMDDYRPVIPEPVISYYLERSGFDCDDVRIKRLIALAAQKFVSDVARDAMEYAKLRMADSSSTASKDRKAKSDKRMVLTMDDLTMALREAGVDATKPAFFS